MPMSKCVCVCVCVHAHYVFFYVQGIFPAAAGSRTDEYKMRKGFGDE